MAPINQPRNPPGWFPLYNAVDGRHPAPSGMYKCIKPCQWQGNSPHINRCRISSINSKAVIKPLFLRRVRLGGRLVDQPCYTWWEGKKISPTHTPPEISWENWWALGKTAISGFYRQHVWNLGIFLLHSKGGLPGRNWKKPWVGCV